mmetsp:Transcript_10457/g.15662  ORF Transcript_10457/g.15662 Transcript_10457/m.15662 type:complete len:168 (+) Transcript_10457:30-533(+)
MMNSFHNCTLYFSSCADSSNMVCRFYAEEFKIIKEQISKMETKIENLQNDLTDEIASKEKLEAKISDQNLKIQNLEKTINNEKEKEKEHKIMEAGVVEKQNKETGAIVFDGKTNNEHLKNVEHFLADKKRKLSNKKFEEATDKIRNEMKDDNKIEKQDFTNTNQKNF